MKSLSMQLLDRSVMAMVAAIEVYNKPGIKYRSEAFTILAINAWELLLKAKWLGLHGNKKQCLYVYVSRQTKKGEKSKKKYIKRTRSNYPYTRDIGSLLNKMVDEHILDSSASKNISILMEFRDCATHFFNDSPVFQTRLYEFGAACVKNFVNAIDEWFQRDVSEFQIHLMPLSFTSLPTNVKGMLFNTEERNFLSYIESIEDFNTDPYSLYSVSVNVEFRFTRSRAKDAISVHTTKDPSALQVNLTEEDIRQRYPWEFATLTSKCRQRYKDFKQNQKYHEIRKRMEGDENYCRLRYLDPGNPRSPKKPFFSPNILFEFDKHYSKNDLK